MVGSLSPSPAAAVPPSSPIPASSTKSTAFSLSWSSMFLFAPPNLFHIFVERYFLHNRSIHRFIRNNWHSSLAPLSHIPPFLPTPVPTKVGWAYKRAGKRTSQDVWRSWWGWKWCHWYYRVWAYCHRFGWTTEQWRAPRNYQRFGQGWFWCGQLRRVHSLVAPNVNSYKYQALKCCT